MRLKLSLILLLLIFLFIGCQPGDETETEREVPVKVFVIKPASISKSIKLTGGITAAKDVILYSKISEKLESINVKAGESVREGQILAVQYNELLKQGVDAAEASFKNAQAQVNLVIQEFERSERLYKQNALSQQQYDQTLTQKQTAEAGLEQASAIMKQAKEQYQNSFIKAPFSGTVAAIYFEVNQMLPAGQPVIHLIGSGGMKAKLKVTAKDIPYIKQGLNTIIKFPSIPDTEFSGVVSSINKAVDAFTKSLEIEVQLNEKDSRLKSGLFGEFYIQVTAKENTVVIPENSLLRQTEVIIDRDKGIQTPVRKYYVYLVKDSRAELVEVEPGISSNGRIEIKSGMNNGDTLIIVGQNIVDEGQKVKVID